MTITKHVVGMLIIFAFIGLCAWSLYFIFENATWCRKVCDPYALKMCGDNLAVCADDSVRKR
jgi:hypothetical protein